MDDAVAAVGATRPHLVDRWEAVAVLESLGYTGDRVRRELGFEDTRAFGAFAFERLSERSAPPEAGGTVALVSSGSAAAARVSALVAGLYAVLWLMAAAADGSGWLAGGPPLTAAAMTALIVHGGVIYGMTRRMGCYRAMDQAPFASAAGTLFWRTGALVTLATAALGVASGRLLGIAPWPDLVIWADAFVLISAVLLTAAWLLSRPAPSAPVPLPRMGVVFLRTIPAVALASLCLAFAFAEPLAAMTGGAGARVPLGGVEPALIAFFAGLAAVEYAAQRFSAGLNEATSVSFTVRSAIRRAGARAHRRALGIVGLASVAGALIGAGMAPWMPGSAASAAHPAIFVGYVLLVLGWLNARVLLSLGRPWMAVGWVAAGLAVTCAVAAAGHAWVGGMDPGAALVPGALVAFVSSSAAVRIVLRRPDYALLEGASG